MDQIELKGPPLGGWTRPADRFISVRTSAYRFIITYYWFIRLQPRGRGRRRRTTLPPWGAGSVRSVRTRMNI